MKKIKNLSTFAGIVTIAILLGSALLAPTLSAYADQGKGKSAAGNNDNDKNKGKGNDNGKGKGNDNDKGKSGAGNNDDNHKKGVKDPDKDKDNNGKHEGCEEGQHLGNDKYKKECDSDHEFKK